jgi:hypothetical protein
MEKNEKIKLPQKGAGKALKELYEKNRSSVKASKELLEILKKGKEKDKLKKIAKPQSDLDI